MSELFLGGLLNITDPIIGFQLYIWLWVAITIVSAIMTLLWYYGGWKPYTPLHGLYYAYKAGSNAAFIFDANLIGEMVDEKTAKCIFDYSTEEYEYESVLDKWLSYYPTAYLDNIDPLHAILYKYGGINKDVEIARHLQNGEWERSPSVICGGVPVDIIVDSDNWTIRTSPQHKAIESACRMWNELNPTDQIHSYSKFQRYLNENKLTCPDIKSTMLVSWTRIDTGFPLDLEESDWAGKRRQMAEQDFNSDLVLKNKMAIWILCGGLGIAFLLIMARLLTFFFN